MVLMARGFPSARCWRGQAKYQESLLSFSTNKRINKKEESYSEHHLVGPAKVCHQANRPHATELAKRFIRRVGEGQGGRPREWGLEGQAD